MKLGVLTTSFPRHPEDVAGTFVWGFARALADRGHTLEVLAPEPCDASQPPALSGVDLRWLPYLRPRSFQRTFYAAGVPDNLRRDPRAWLGLLPYSVQLARHTRRAMAGWDAVISHWALPCGWVAASLPGRPRHLAVLHSADVHGLTRLPLGRALASQVARGADALLFVSSRLRQQFLNLLDPLHSARIAGACHVCPMGIDPACPSDLSREALRRARAIGNEFCVVSIGRLVRVKGLETAIEAARQCTKMQLVIAGEGPERGRLERLARGAPGVRFVGHADSLEKRRWFAAADAFVLPSIELPSGRTEGTPTALLEALDAGLPVVASDVGGIREVVRDGVEGLLVPPGDASALRDALGRLRQRSERTRFASHARRRARDFHWTSIAPHLENLLTGDDVALEQRER